ncbi:MAG: hypothetical protein HKN09_09925 [Saprospiraceae bacterium]|nr:hypothetical protein [Saprospiraceae bacterium]
MMELETQNNTATDPLYINYRNVDLYDRDKLVYEKLNFQLKKGELLYIAGSDNEIAHLILSSFYAHARLEGEFAQVLEYDLMDIDRSAVTALRQSIGLVLNNQFLYDNLSLEENFNKFKDIIGELFAGPIQTDSRAWLASFGLNPDSMPGDISANERVIYSFAKALLHQPKIIFVEDQFAQLELESQIVIMDTLIERLRAETCSVVMVQSNSEFIERFPGMIFICNAETKTMA